jgi:hypothetical protein
MGVHNRQLLSQARGVTELDAGTAENISGEVIVVHIVR